MGTFKAYFKKEILESSRQYRYIIFGAGIILFAILDPIMLKLLPEIMKSQLKGDLSSLFIMTRKAVLQNYIKDLFQLGNLFVIFSLCGTLSDEISLQKLIFPYSKNASAFQMILAKFIHYLIVVCIFVFAGFTLNFYYANLLFKGDTVAFDKVLISACLIILYYSVSISLTIFFSSLFKKGITAGIASAVLCYISIPLSEIKSIQNYLPYRLIQTASTFDTVQVLIIITGSVYCILFCILSSKRMGKVQTL